MNSHQQINNIQEYVTNAIIEHLKKRDANYERFKEVAYDLIERNNGAPENRKHVNYKKCNGCDYILKYGQECEEGDHFEICNDCVVLKRYCSQCSSNKDIGELYVPDTEEERWLCRECINFIEENEETVRNLIDKEKCTRNVYYNVKLGDFDYSESRARYVKQKYRRCFTCEHSYDNGKGICVSCVTKKCHEGHELSNELEADFICDCTCEKFK